MKKCLGWHFELERHGNGLSESIELHAVCSGESVEQGVVLYKGCARSRTSLSLSSAAWVLGVVGIAADLPVLRLQGLLATCGVALCKESLLVLGDLGDVLRAVADCRCYRGESYSSEKLVSTRRRAALHFLTQVQAVAVRVLRSCYTVRAQQHFRTTVLTVLTGFTQCAGYVIDTGTPFYFCHNS